MLAQTVVVLEEVDLTASNLTVTQVGCIVVVFEEVGDVTASSPTRFFVFCIARNSFFCVKVEEVLRAVLHSEFRSPLWRLYLPQLHHEVTFLSITKSHGWVYA